jgi:SAM-dependent methyltransferase
MKLRDIANVSLDRLSHLGLAARLTLQRGLHLTHDYQPDPYDAAPVHDPRACLGRFQAADALLRDLSCPSVLDVGCNQGFFTFRFAQKGGVCLGVDNDRAELMAARARAELRKVRNIAFLEMTLDKETIHGLPVSDIVVCLSVFHHWVRHYGPDGAMEMLALLTSKVGKVLIFDSGQPEEASTNWAPSLSFMLPSGPAWISRHLESLGFSQVKEVGVFPTSLSAVPRSLFVARRV